MAKRAGRDCPELKQPEVDKQIIYLWRWFCELAQGRQHNGMGANTLAWSEMKAWAELTSRAPNEWEIATLRAIDWNYLYD